jgi:hypothetical protein
MLTEIYHHFFDLDNSVTWTDGAAIAGVMVKWWIIEENRE